MAGNRVLTEPYPTVQAAGAPSNDYERIPSSPAMFGGLVGQAEEKLGQGGLAVSNAGGQLQNFYNQTTAQDAFNKYNSAISKITFGDPNDPSNPGYFALKGSDALSARPKVQDQIEQARQQLRSGLNPVAQFQFDEDSRRLQTYTLGDIGRHADQQFDIYSQATQKAAEDNAVHNAGLNYNSDEAYNRSAANGAAAVARRVQSQGLGPDTLESELDAFHTRLVASRVEGMLTRDPQGAKAFLDQNQKNIDPQVYDQLTSRLRPMLAGTAADNAVDYAAKNPKASAPQGAPASGGFSPDGLARTAQIESHGDPNAKNPSGAKGLTQFMDSTWAKYGVGSPYDPAQSLAAAQRYSADNAKTLTQNLGRAPTDAELYLAHQQGAGGASKLLSNPTVRAGDLVGDNAIRANGGDPNKPASAFTSMWIEKFGQTKGSPGTFGLSGPQSTGGAAPVMGAPGSATAASSTMVGLPTNFPDESLAIQHAYAEANGDPIQQRMNVQATREKFTVMNASLATERQSISAQLPDLMKAAQDGVAGVSLPEARIRAVFTPDKVDRLIGEFNTAQTVGSMMRGVQFAAPDEVAATARDIESGQGVLSTMLKSHTGVASTGPGAVGASPEGETAYFRMRTQAARQLQAVVNNRNQALFGASADPAAYVASEPSVKAANAAMLSDPTKTQDWVNASLGIQTHLGVPLAQQHVLTRGQAVDISGKMMAPGTDVPAQLKNLQNQFGDSYKDVFSDLVTLGKLPSTYQAVAALPDANDAALLGRALQDSSGAGTKAVAAWKDRVEVATGNKQAFTNIQSSVLSSPDVAQYTASLRAQGVSAKNADNMVLDIQTLAFAKAVYNHEPPATAAQNAIQSFTGHFTYGLPGAPRVPTQVSAQVEDAARTTLAGVNANSIVVPPGHGGHGEPSVEDYIAGIKSRGAWVNSPKADGIILKDHGDRIVRGVDGQPIEIPFSDIKPALTAPAAEASSANAIDLGNITGVGPISKQSILGPRRF